ncbi:MAG: hypothetical protein AAF639_16570 [Chloroflexota bacterium]
MDMHELDLEIGYPKLRFDMVQTLNKLSSFAKLIGGDHAAWVSPIVPNWSTLETKQIEENTVMAKIQDRLDQQRQFHLRIAFVMPLVPQLRSELTMNGYSYYNYNDILSDGILIEQNKITVGNATVYIGSYAERATVVILPDTHIVSHFMRHFTTIHSRLVEFCRETGASEAFWENDEEEIVQPIWPHPTASHISSTAKEDGMGVFNNILEEVTQQQPHRELVPS